MMPINQGLSEAAVQEKMKNWTQDMKDTHKEVLNDFKSGTLKTRDISLTKVQEIGNKIIKQVFNSVEGLYRDIKDSLFSEAKKDLS